MLRRPPGFEFLQILTNVFVKGASGEVGQDPQMGIKE